MPLPEVRTAFAGLLRDAPGIVLADDHAERDILASLKHLLPEMHAVGVKRLYLEYVPAHAQEYVEHFQAGLMSRSELAETLRQISGERYYRGMAEAYAELIETATALGITVHGVDVRTPAQQRIHGANQAWQQHIVAQESTHSDGKFALFCGGLHTEKWNLYADGQEDRARGVDCLLQVPAVSFAVSEYARQPKLRPGQPGMPEGDQVMILPKSLLQSHSIRL